MGRGRGTVVAPGGARKKRGGGGEGVSLSLVGVVFSP